MPWGTPFLNTFYSWWAITHTHCACASGGLPLSHKIHFPLTQFPPVQWRGSIVSHIKPEVLVYFLPMFGFSPSKHEEKAHLPFVSLGWSFPSCILVRYITWFPSYPYSMLWFSFRRGWNFLGRFLGDDDAREPWHGYHLLFVKCQAFPGIFYTYSYLELFVKTRLSEQTVLDLTHKRYGAHPYIGRGGPRIKHLWTNRSLGCPNLEEHTSRMVLLLGHFIYGFSWFESSTN